MLVSGTPTQSCLSHCISGSLSSICESGGGSSPWEQREARGGCTHVCNAEESRRGGGEAAGVEQGSSQRLQLWGWGRGPHEDSKHLSSEVRKTCPETKLESLPCHRCAGSVSRACQPSPHPTLGISAHEASLRDSPAFPVRK